MNEEIQAGSLAALSFFSITVVGHCIAKRFAAFTGPHLTLKFYEARIWKDGAQIRSIPYKDDRTRRWFHPYSLLCDGFRGSGRVRERVLRGRPWSTGIAIVDRSSLSLASPSWLRYSSLSLLARSLHLSFEALGVLLSRGGSFVSPPLLRIKRLTAG